MHDTASLYIRSKKTIKNPHGLTEVKKIPHENICVVCLGGDETNTDKSANGYAKIIENMLNDSNIKDVPIYSIKYNFTDLESGYKSRKFTFLKHRVKALNLESGAQVNKFYDETDKSLANPKYINDLYKNLIQDRISKNNGKKKLTVEDAAKNMRKINFVAHCHGGFTIFKLMEKMQREIKKLGYSLEEENKIFSQTFIAGYASACPYGKTSAQFYNFVSAKDNLRPASQNHFDHHREELISDEASKFYAQKSGDEEMVAALDNFEVKPSYIPSKKLFYIDSYYPPIHEDTYVYTNPKEHNISHENSELTDDGKLLTQISTNMLINAVKNSLIQKKDSSLVPLPELEKLICKGNPKEKQEIIDTFDEMKSNGQDHVKEVNQFALELRKERKSY